MKHYSIRRDFTTNKIDYENELNPSQLEAVSAGDGPALVLAGAGSGKTRTIIYRVSWLVEKGIKSHEILLLTFTNKAAREMMRRSEAIVGSSIGSLWGGTFHHICNRMLRRYGELLGYKNGFLILDRTDSKDLLGSCALELGRKEKLIPAGAVLINIYSYIKNTLEPLENVIEKKYFMYVDVMEEIADIINMYEAKKFKLNLMDFDDILLNAKKLLLNHEEVQREYSGRFRYILVDEYQDTNVLQAEIVELLSKEHGNQMVVGDDGQSIFSFRGANFENILNFPVKHKNAQVFKLTVNYRSTPEILGLANNVIIHNKRQFPKDLTSVKESGQLPLLVPLEDVYLQAEFVASRILDLRDDGVESSEVAVLYRAHYQAMELELELKRRGILYEVRSGLKFLEQAHIKDILSFLRIVVNPYDELSWKRALKMIPWVGNKTADKVWGVLSESDSPLESIKSTENLFKKTSKEYFKNKFLPLINKIKDRQDPSECLDIVLREVYDEYLFKKYDNAGQRLEDIEQMTLYAKKYENIMDFVNEMSLDDKQGVGDDEFGETEGKVVLSSIHQAKGLEWEVVFVIGLNNGRFPLSRSLQSGEEEEERRLFYVAVTRACCELYLCYCISSNTGFLKPSMFLQECDPCLFEEVVIN